MLQLSFKQTNSELMVRAAATVLFTALERANVPMVTIGDLCERPQYGFTASAALEPIGPKFVRITDLQDGKIDWASVPFCKCEDPAKYTLGENDILFARTGATTGKTYLVRGSQSAVFASYLIRLRSKSNVEAGYLYSFFQSDNYWAQISEEKEGSAQPNVNGEKLVSLRIPSIRPDLQRSISKFIDCVRCRQDGRSLDLPELLPPLAEQRQVVSRIEEMAGEINEARTLRHQAIEETEAFRLARVADVFFRAGKRVPLGQTDACQIVCGQHLAPEEQTDSGIPYMTGPADFGPRTAVPSRYAFSARALAMPGDVLLTVKGAGVGKVNLAPSIPAAIGRQLYALRPKLGRLDQVFLYYALQDGLWHFRESMTATTVPGIGRREVEKLSIPFPELPEQREIAAHLDDFQKQMDALIVLQTETTAELNALMPSILAKAFRGEF